VRSVRRSATVVLLALVAVSCGSAARQATPAASSTTSSVADPTSTTTVPPSTTTTSAPVTPTRATVPTTTVPTTTTTAGAVLPDARLGDVGSAGQAVLVTAAAPGATTATLTAYERVGTAWRAVYGPWTARVGTRGIAPPGAKREGDGRTPSGVYAFDFFFGVLADPGVNFAYRRITSRSIVWDDDPASPTYNLWRDSATESVGADPEPMYTTPAYEYGAVIAYNADRTPGLGSAIFLHESTGGPTAGCVSLPVDQLLSVLRWLDPARQPRIAIGIAS
jgi:L,D-peptidoglycan transpeptidase YkuD (ErfK/YbiS/YcfS/YnhG family)